MKGSLRCCTARLRFPSCPGLPGDDSGIKGRRRGWRSRDEEEEMAGQYRSWTLGRETAACFPASSGGWHQPWPLAWEQPPRWTCLAEGWCPECASSLHAADVHGAAVVGADVTGCLCTRADAGPASESWQFPACDNGKKSVSVITIKWKGEIMHSKRMHDTFNLYRTKSWKTFHTLVFFNPHFTTMKNPDLPSLGNAVLWVYFL